ncbi:phosphoglycerate mutase family protein-like protein [Aulographum hederae CBS 113979]|uniref:Phosphoglycerate mutase family protein-like protein n=1 Tax=Aulographum hederae CBS 113979 TaxID=1176131 RepID=A0A6G1GL33_9PEZI|nr:phosphoglycerate mutase family protein-like protein [Aulographum hederae CBS 113979]
MPPRLIHLVRHAQGFHNLSYANHSMPDPLLTDYGIQQCRDLSSNFPSLDSLSLIVASPLKRTLYTALYSFEAPIAAKKLAVVALPELQETSDLPCDTGSSVQELEKEFAGEPVDLRQLDGREDWNSKKGPWAPYEDMISARARVARQWLMGREEEEEIAIVTHGGFLHYLTEDWSDHDKFVGTGWANTEFRSYTFDPNGGANASLVETQESLQRRAGDSKRLSETEQRNLKLTAQKSWQAEGFTAKTGVPETDAKL